ncbi:SH3 domain-containing C40 family peptidase [Paenibacillus sp. MSJ-34]|uniref:C40 family peptidase n=1 Tax=Paenibacillus sp. MSJ-34 TaxID=2841529 RepID=UPI001C102166|nr:SH3 domain-containing C40 family peptidase [Paenibacillus sp. MSJ-34]MBU5443287.1 C40 family peptidase [Paenibacillus sp. MSJ-34]
MKKLLMGLLLVSLVGQAYAATAAAATQPATQSAAIAASSAQTGTVKASVNLRNKPSLSGSVVRLMKKGEQVTILGQENSAWYKVRDGLGNVGYMSTSSKYMTVAGGSVTPEQPSDKPAEKPAAGTASEKIEKVISTGMKYLGTPYEFGSNRNSTKTFDCSAFVRQAFKEAIGITLPTDSRKQGNWIRQNSTVKKSISELKRGDLMFFSSYKGTKASSYANMQWDKERITHVGIYLGEGKILHTYSKTSGGVRTDTIKGKHWEYRFLYGGSVVK